MTKKQKIIVTEIALYFLTVLGVAMSRWIPYLKEILAGEMSPVIGLSWVRLITAMILGLVITFLIDKDGSPDGKLNNFKKRAVNYLAYGALWYTLIGELL